MGKREGGGARLALASSGLLLEQMVHREILFVYATTVQLLLSLSLSLPSLGRKIALCPLVKSHMAVMGRRTPGARTDSPSLQNQRAVCQNVHPPVCLSVQREEEHTLYIYIYIDTVPLCVGSYIMCVFSVLALPTLV